jgi:hypothetical protein
MSANPTLLTDIPDRVCADIKAILPELKKCERIEGKFSIAELKKGGVPGPSVLVSLLGAKQDTTFAASTPSFLMQMSAYVITRDTLKMPRDVAAASICRVLISHIPEQRWEQAECGPARDVAMHCLVSSNARDITASLWAVTWNQPIMFCEANEGPLGVELYVSQAPNIGTAHVDEYELVDGGSNDT